MIHVSLGDDEPAFKLDHGLYYVDRYQDNGTLFRLDREQMPEVGRPERDVLKALLRYALDRLDAQP